MSDLAHTLGHTVSARHSDPEQRGGSESQYFAGARIIARTNTEILDLRFRMTTREGIGAGEEVAA